MSNTKCFISYSWDSSSHKDWVRFLAERLHNKGVYTFLDQWDLSPGSQLTKYMETSIRESAFVLLVCTRNFALKADEGKGGVGYEKNIVTGEMFNNTNSDSKFVAILREGEPKASLPSYLKSKVYLDFRNDIDFEANLEELLRHIYGEPKYVRPSLGTKPKLDGNPFKNGVQAYLGQTFDQIESLIISYGAQVISRKNRTVEVYLNDRSVIYDRPKRKRHKPVSEGLLKEFSKLFKEDELIY
jgi:hypothetical protein